TGRPSNTSDVNPWLRIHERWFMPARPVAANHAALLLLVVMVPYVSLSADAREGPAHRTGAWPTRLNEDRDRGRRWALGAAPASDRSRFLADHAAGGHSHLRVVRAAAATAPPTAQTLPRAAICAAICR